MSGFTPSSREGSSVGAPVRRGPRYSLGSTRAAPLRSTSRASLHSSSKGEGATPSRPRPSLAVAPYDTSFDGAEFCIDLSAKIAAALQASKSAKLPLYARASTTSSSMAASFAQPGVPPSSFAYATPNMVTATQSISTQSVQAGLGERDLSPDLAGILTSPLLEKGKARQLESSSDNLAASSSVGLSNAEWLARSEALYAAKLHAEQVAAGITPRVVEVATQTDPPLIAPRQTQTEEVQVGKITPIDRARLAGRAVEELLGRGGVVPVEGIQSISLADTFQPVAGEEAGPSNLFAQGMNLEDILRKRAALLEEQMSEDSAEEESEEEEQDEEPRKNKNLIEELRDTPTLEEVLHGNAGIAMQGDDERIGTDSASEGYDDEDELGEEQDGQYDDEEDELMGSEDAEQDGAHALLDSSSQQHQPQYFQQQQQLHHADQQQEEYDSYEEYSDEEEDATPEQDSPVKPHGGIRADEPIELLDSDDDDAPPTKSSQRAPSAAPARASESAWQDYSQHMRAAPSVDAQGSPHIAQAMWDGLQSATFDTGLQPHDNGGMLDFEVMEDDDDEDVPDLDWSVRPSAPAPAPGHQTQASAQAGPSDTNAVQADQANFAELYGYDTSQAGLDPALFGDVYEQPASPSQSAPPALTSVIAATAYHAPTPPWATGEDEPASVSDASALAGFAAYAVNEQNIQAALAAVSSARSPAPLLSPSGAPPQPKLPPGTPGVEAPAPPAEPASNPVASSAGLLAFKQQVKEDRPSSTAVSVASALEAGESGAPSSLPLAPGSAGLLAFKRQNPGPIASSSVAVSVGTATPAEGPSTPANEVPPTAIPRDASDLVAFTEEDTKEDAPPAAATLVTHDDPQAPRGSGVAKPQSDSAEAMDTSQDQPQQQELQQPVPPAAQDPLIQDAQDLFALKAASNVPEQKKVASIVSLADSEDELDPAPTSAALEPASASSPVAFVSEQPVTAAWDANEAVAPMETDDTFPIPPPDQPAADAEPAPRGTNDPAAPSTGTELLSFKEQASEVALSPNAAPAVAAAPAASLRSLDGSAHKEPVRDPADQAAVASGEELVQFKERVEETAPANEEAKAQTDKSIDGSTKQVSPQIASAAEVAVQETEQFPEPQVEKQQARESSSPEKKRLARSSPPSVRSGPGSDRSAEVDRLDEHHEPEADRTLDHARSGQMAELLVAEQLRAAIQEPLAEPGRAEQKSAEEKHEEQQRILEPIAVLQQSTTSAKDLRTPAMQPELEQMDTPPEEHAPDAQPPTSAASLIAAHSPVAEAQATSLAAAASSMPAPRSGEQQEPIELEDSSVEGTPSPELGGEVQSPFVADDEKANAEAEQALILEGSTTSEEQPQEVQARDGTPEADHEFILQPPSSAPFVESQVQFADAVEQPTAEELLITQDASTTQEASPIIEDQSQSIIEEPRSAEAPSGVQGMSLDEDQPMPDMDEIPDFSMSSPPAEDEHEPASCSSHTPPPLASGSPVLGKRKAESPPAAEGEVEGRTTRRKLKEALFPASANHEGPSSRAFKQDTPASPSASTGLAAAVLNAVAPVIPSIFKPASPSGSAPSRTSKQSTSSSTSSFVSQLAALRRNRHFHQHGTGASARPLLTRSISASGPTSTHGPPSSQQHVKFASEAEVAPSATAETQDVPSPAGSQIDEEKDEGGYEGPATRSRCRYHIVTLPWSESPFGRCIFAVPGCSIAHDKLAAEDATHKGKATEAENNAKEWFDADDLPEELYHAISRIVDPELLGDVAVLPASRPPGLATWSGEDSEANDMPHVPHDESGLDQSKEILDVQVDIPNGQDSTVAARTAFASSETLSSPSPTSRITRAIRRTSNASSIPATSARTLRKRGPITASDLVEESKASQGSSTSSASRRASSRLAGIDANVDELETPLITSRSRKIAPARDASPAAAVDEARSISPVAPLENSASKKRKAFRRTRRSDPTGAEANYLPHTSSSDSEDAAGSRRRHKSNYESDGQDVGPSARATSVLDAPDDFISTDVLERAVSAVASDAEAEQADHELNSMSPAKPAAKPLRTYKRTRRSGAATDTSFHDTIEQDLPPSEDEDIAERAAAQARKKAAAHARQEEKRVERQAVREEEKEAAALLISLPDPKKRRRTADPAFDPRKVVEEEADEEEDSEDKRLTRKERARRSRSKREKSEVREDQIAATTRPQPPASESSPRPSRPRRRGAA